ncbi:MAG TPA: hypothetical protein VMR16_00365, partial [Candidatus Saccharimonadales bacterium]|nr:hypothetical protein [Candidatus Saccharimonadales bacterium]
MTEDKNYDTLAGIQFRNVERTGPNGYGNDHLRVELGKLGVGTVVIPNIDAYKIEQGSVLAHPTTGDLHMSLGNLREYPINESGVEVVRSRIATQYGLESQVPILNSRELRAIGTSKIAQYELASDYMPKTVAIEEGQPPDPSMFDALIGDKLVVKADMSAESRYMAICARGEVVPP